MLVFFGDTNSELWWEKVEQNNINMINMPYILDGELKYVDLGKNKDYIKFFEAIKSGVQASTCGLNKQDYLDYFEPHLKNGDDIIYVTFSHAMSNTFEYMRQAIDELKTKYPERSIDCVDTRMISVGEELVLWEAYKFYKQGKTAKEIVEFVEKISNEFVCSFAVDDLNHLKKGGRINGTTAFFGTILQIKPILYVGQSGKIEKLDKAKGKKQAIDFLVNLIKTKGKDVANYPIIIAHANDIETANLIAQKIREVVGENVDIWTQPIGATIGTHCGPGTFGIGFHGERF